MPAADYYLDKLELLLTWVRQHHAALIDDSGWAFLARFAALPTPARRLYVRLLMRRGPWFRLDQLDYEEVGAADTAVLALCLGGLARLAGAEGWEQRLRLLRVPELRDLVLRRAPRQGSQCRRRADWLAVCSHLGPIDLGLLPQAVRLAPTTGLDLLRMLYFGNAHQDLIEFILTDLGVLRFEVVPMRPALPWRTAAEAREDLRREQWADQVSAWSESTDVEVAESALLAAGSVLSLPAQAPSTERRRNRALTRLAALWQRQGRPDRSLGVLADASGPPAREKRIRLLVREAGPEVAASALSELAGDAVDPDECRFLAHFDPWQGRCRPASRHDGIRRSRLLLRRQDAAAKIEEVVAGVLRSGGCQVLHLENALIGLLLGLAFWDLVFAPLPGAFVQPFQRGPLDLFEPEFAPRRAAAIEERLAALACGEHDVLDLLDVWQRKHGTMNALVAWSRFSDTDVRQICEGLSPRVKAALCGIALREPALLRRGFPDLLLLGGEAERYEFIEVKGPGDVLRPEQRLWFAELEAADLSSRVLEVRWA